METASPGSADWLGGRAEHSTAALDPGCWLPSTVYMPCIWLTSPMGIGPHGRCAVDERYQHRACKAEGRQGVGYWHRAKRELLKGLIRATSCCLASTSRANAEPAQCWTGFRRPTVEFRGPGRPTPSPFFRSYPREKGRTVRPIRATERECKSGRSRLEPPCVRASPAIG
jgi:hypothetical protein